MDVQYINPFVLSIQHVFETMIRAAVHVGNPFIKHDTNALTDISGVICLSGDVHGSVVLSFPGPVATRAVAAFAGVSMATDDPDFADAIGELANMVAGNAKKRFHNMKVCISLPSVLIGKQNVVSSTPSGPRVIIPCETEFGIFYMEIGVAATTRGVSRQSTASNAGAGP